jgi:hypothetical protein
MEIVTFSERGRAQEDVTNVIDRSIRIRPSDEHRQGEGVSRRAGSVRIEESLWNCSPLESSLGHTTPVPRWLEGASEQGSTILKSVSGSAVAPMSAGIPVRSCRFLRNQLRAHSEIALD